MRRSVFAKVPVEGTKDQIYIRHPDEGKWCEAQNKDFVCTKGGNAWEKNKFVYETWDEGHHISLKKQVKAGRVCADEFDDGVRCNRNIIESWEKFRAYAVEDIMPLGDPVCPTNHDMAHIRPAVRHQWFDNHDDCHECSHHGNCTAPAKPSAKRLCRHGWCSNL